MSCSECDYDYDENDLEEARDEGREEGREEGYDDGHMDAVADVLSSVESFADAEENLVVKSRLEELLKELRESFQ